MQIHESKSWESEAAMGEGHIEGGEDVISGEAC